MITTRDLTFRYRAGEAIFRFPDISLASGEHLLILGESGVGKTTLLHLLAGLLRPLNGEITLEDVPISGLSERKMDRFRGGNIGLVFQKNHAIRSLNVQENLRARLFFSRKNMPKSVVADLLEELGLADCRHKKTTELSEGQLQRLGIAMAVVHAPRIILADEPTSSLDDTNCTTVIDLLMGQARANNANLVVITHDHRIKPFFPNTLVL